MKGKRLIAGCLVLGLMSLAMTGCNKKDNKAEEAKNISENVNVSNSQQPEYTSIVGKKFYIDYVDYYNGASVPEGNKRSTITFNRDLSCETSGDVEGNYAAAGSYAQTKDYIFISWFAFGELDAYTYSFDGEKLVLTGAEGEQENYTFLEDVKDQEATSTGESQNNKNIETKKLVGKFELKTDEGDTSKLPFVVKEGLLYSFNEDGTCSCLNKENNEEKQGIFAQSNSLVFICWNNSMKDIESCMVDGEGKVVLYKKLIEVSDKGIKSEKGREIELKPIS